jgi:hypothetical protein
MVTRGAAARRDKHLQNIPNGRAGRGRDDGDPPGVGGQAFLPFHIEQTLGGQCFLTPFQCFKESTFPGRFQSINDELIGSPGGIHVNLPGCHHRLIPSSGFSVDPAARPRNRTADMTEPESLRVK